MTDRLLAAFSAFMVCVAIGLGGGYYYFYEGTEYVPPEVARATFDGITAPRVAPNPVDATVIRGKSEGLFLVDALHSNAFRASEIAALQARIAERGYEVEFVGDFGITPESERLPRLEAELRRADSFLVILPRQEYSGAEADLVERFVGKGGKLLLISDPTRPQRINALAQRFGVSFQPDYLYNQVEYDLNFQNIMVREFQPEEITAGLEAIALYTAGSIRSSGPGLAFIDSNTKSSVAETDDELYPMAWGDTRNVLSIGDLTFMIPPRDALLDNGRLVSNIADYVTDGGREFDLADYPHFLGSGPSDGVDILLGRATLLSSGTDVKNGLSGYGINAGIRGIEDVSRDTVFLGLYEDAGQVSRYLQGAGVRVDDTLGTPFHDGAELAGSTVIVLDRQQGRHVLIALADTPEALSSAVNRLLDGGFRDDLVSDFAAVTLSAATADTTAGDIGNGE